MMMNQVSNYYGPLSMRGDHHHHHDHDREMMMKMMMMGYTEMKKRQLFLRSYRFSRKKSLSERMKKSLFKVKSVVWLRLRSARKIRKMVKSRLRHGLASFATRRRRFSLRLHNNGAHYFHARLSWPSFSLS